MSATIIALGLVIALLVIWNLVLLRRNYGPLFVPKDAIIKNEKWYLIHLQPKSDFEAFLMAKADNPKVAVQTACKNGYLLPDMKDFEMAETKRSYLGSKNSERGFQNIRIETVRTIDPEEWQDKATPPAE